MGKVLKEIDDPWYKEGIFEGYDTLLNWKWVIDNPP